MSGGILWQALTALYFRQNRLPDRAVSAFTAGSQRFDRILLQSCLRDRDAVDIGLIYKTNADEFENVLHELINWMRDHEQGIGLYENIWNVYEFFPDCGCERTRW